MNAFLWTYTLYLISSRKLEERFLDDCLIFLDEWFRAALYLVMAVEKLPCCAELLAFTLNIELVKVG
ncbi:hypothetical protein IPC327_25710 [Pseudomonas aeruginosa]|nr:hypothetical protein IPC327_25710 [Pseudomonas aeruginosa]